MNHIITKRKKCSYLQQVITNEDVVAMVKNTLHDLTRDDTEIDLLPATYEPKMTRSKFKEVLEKDGTVSRHSKIEHL